MGVSGDREALDESIGVAVIANQIAHTLDWSDALMRATLAFRALREVADILVKQRSEEDAG